jgi:hypothetical protein
LDPIIVVVVVIILFCSNDVYYFIAFFFIPNGVFQNQSYFSSKQQAGGLVLQEM